MSAPFEFHLTEGPPDPAEERAALAGAGAGAIVVFEGRVRGVSRGRTVERLEYEAHGELARRTIETILREAAERHPVRAARVAHATGILRPGDLAVWIGVATERRHAAFAACEFVLGQLKRRAPIWRREVFADGGTEWSPTPDAIA